MSLHGSWQSLLDTGVHLRQAPRLTVVNLTLFGRAMQQLGIEMLPAYSPEARGRSERGFSTHQGRLPKELVLVGITELEEANRYIREWYLPSFNIEFK